MGPVPFQETRLWELVGDRLGLGTQAKAVNPFLCCLRNNHFEQVLWRELGERTTIHRHIEFG